MVFAIDWKSTAYNFPAATVTIKNCIGIKARQMSLSKTRVFFDIYLILL